MAFDGTWKVDRNENYEKFMEVMGVNIMKRKLGAHDNLKIIIQQDGNNFTVKESSTFRNIDITFTLAQPFEYSLADGTELNGSWFLQDNQLLGTFTRKDNGKVLQTTRQIIGDELVQTYVYEGTEAKRIFKRG
ncbi:fatty acid-binding protein, intestinal [Xenopus tropicalis]|uniref:Fatty acid-binding protein, intestinal n=1 Tax=Xenopus tropicalis TaxID=8364 RepID=A4IHF6_XENTR|eukprot:NP_001106373.1 fatty acid-binding protein, intestinal [Xenopus tropicalis]